MMALTSSTSEISQLIEIKRGIGPFSAATFVVGAIVGTGIFVTPIGVLRHAGSIGGSLAIWCGSAIIATIGALCYIELGTTFPQSGSDFTYLRMCLGELPAFLYLWVNMLVMAPAGTVIQALTFANYVLGPFFPNCPVPQDGVRIIAAVVICFLTYINCRNVAWATRVQVIFTVAKIVALIVIILAGAYCLLTGHTENFENVFEGTTREPGDIALALYSGFYTYAGWNYLNSVTEELKDPLKNLPRTVYISLPLVTVIYVFANIAYFAVLSNEEMLSSNAVAVTFGDRILGVMSWIMPLSVALSTFGGVNGHIFSVSRILFIGAREGHLPNYLSMLNIHYFTPVPSLVFSCLISLAYISTTDVYVLINCTIFGASIFMTLSIVGMIWLRYRQPELGRPFKVPLLLPLTYLAVCLLLVALPLYVRPWETAIGIAITLTGIPVYFVTVFWNDKPKIYSTFIGKVTELVQKVLLSLPEEKKMTQ